MRYKTLIINGGTKFREFYGFESDLGWVTCAKPIHMMPEDTTWEDVKNAFPYDPFDGVDLVTIEIKIIEE